MEQDIFINEAFTYGINNYLNKINEEEFETLIIKMLVSIYGELDIINPYKTLTESEMGGFNSNVTKYGYSLEELSIFKQNVMNFYLTKNIKPNKYFDEINKNLIDMFFLKVKNINEVNFESFEALLPKKNTSLNNMYSMNKNDIKKYFNYKNKMNKLNVNYKVVEKNTLSKEAYEMLGYSYDNISNMNSPEIYDINNKVFEYFKVDQSRDDKYLRLEQAIKYYKMFPKNEKKAENGYVEFLLLSGFIATSLLVITVLVGVLVR